MTRRLLRPCGLAHPRRFAADIEAGDPPPAPGPRALLLAVQADLLRSPVDIGWYPVDILIRLVLVGAIVGFILILSARSPTGRT